MPAATTVAAYREVDLGGDHVLELLHGIPRRSMTNVGGHPTPGSEALLKSLNMAASEIWLVYKTK